MFFQCRKIGTPLDTAHSRKNSSGIRRAPLRNIVQRCWRYSFQAACLVIIIIYDYHYIYDSHDHYPWWHHDNIIILLIIIFYKLSWCLLSTEICQPRNVSAEAALNCHVTVVGPTCGQDFPMVPPNEKLVLQRVNGDGSKPCTPGEHQNSW